MADCHTGTWTNDSQTLHAKPYKICEAASKQDLVEVTRQAVADGKKIRVGGGGHSWYPLVLTDDSVEPDDGDYYIVLVEKMNQVTTEVTAGGLNLVHVEPGATMGDVQKVTMGGWPDNPPAHPMAFPTNGVIPVGIQEGGFVAAGCHGTGWQQPTVPDLVSSLEMILVDDKKQVQVRTFSEADDGELMNVLRVNLGSIGIMSKITFTAEPLYCMHAVDTIQPMAQVINRNPDASSHPLKDLIESPETEYVELFWFPYNKTKFHHEEGSFLPAPIPDLDATELWVKTAHRLASTGGCPQGEPSQAWDKVAALFGKSMYQLIAWLPSAELTPPVLETMAKTAYLTAAADYVAPATRVFHYQSVAFPVLDFSFAIPLDASTDPYYRQLTAAWYEVVDGVVDFAVNKPEAYQKFPVNVTLHARFIKNSQSLLSPAYQPAGSQVHTCWIEFLSGAPGPPGTAEDWYTHYNDTWAEFCQRIGPKWMAAGGRPHWAKQWQLLEEQGIYPHIKKSYGENLTRFKAERDRLDPHGIFLNKYVAKIFA